MLRSGRAARLPWGWFAVAGLTVAVAASWAPLLGTRFGDNHYGRVHSRYALHVRNFQQDGLLGSHFSADWFPYVTTPYAHHPPLQNLLGILFGTLPGEGEWQVRLGPYLLGLLAVPAAAAILRGLGLRWGPTLLAVGGMAATGLFWLYGLLRYDLAIILALAAVVIRLRRLPAPPAWLVAAAGVLALLAGLGSWPSLAYTVALVGWLLVTRRLDRVAAVVAGCGLAGVAASLGFVAGIHGFGELAEQTGERTVGGSFSVAEFLARQWGYLVELLPVWYLVLFPVAVVAGLADRRTRFLTALSAAYATGWVLVLHNGAYLHDYWAFLLLVPGVVGMGALFDRLAGRALPGAAARLGGVGFAGLATVGLAVLALGPVPQEHLYRPVAAGRLVADHPPASDQRYAWHTGLLPPRWLSYYWDLPPRVASPELLACVAGPADRVVLDRTRLPDWLPAAVMPEPVARDGRYLLVRAGDLAATTGPACPPS